MANTVKGTVKARRVAILAAAGVNGTELSGMKSALSTAGAKVDVVAPRLGQIQSADGQGIMVDKTFATSGSVLYDAVFVPGGASSVEALRQQGDAVHFVNEAFKHCKAIAASSEGVDLLMASDLNGAGAGRTNGRSNGKGRLPEDPAVVVDGKATDLRGLTDRFIAAIGQHRNFARQHKERVPA